MQLWRMKAAIVWTGVNFKEKSERARAAPCVEKADKKNPALSANLVGMARKTGPGSLEAG
jgi:hypothetical protein